MATTAKETPTGNELRMTAVAIHRIADGQIAEHWSDTDELGLLRQLGVVSLPEPE